MKWLIMGLIIIIYLVETVVSRLNAEYSKKPIPERIKDIYDQERYEKWLAYSTELNGFSFIRRGFNLVVLIILLNGTFAYFFQVVSGVTNNVVFQTLLFLLIYETLTTILSIPFQIYHTFSIEERHGFNRTTHKTFIRDTMVGYLLTLVIGGVIIGGLNLLYLRFSANLWIFILIAWASLSLIMILVVTFLTKLFLRLFNKFTPLEEGSLKTKIEDLASGLGFNIKAISIMDASKRSTKSNAFFSGIGKNKEVVLYDTLVEQMSEDEILAVLAHELGHAKYKDTLRLLGMQIALALGYSAVIGFVLENKALFTSFGFPTVFFGFAFILFSILLQPIMLLLNLPLNQYLRKAEYRADQFAAKHTNSKWLISALKVISRENLSNLNPHPVAVKLYYSHPPMNERVKALEK